MSNNNEPDISTEGGFLKVDGVKVCRVSPGHVLIHDKDANRSLRKGRSQIPVSARQFIEAVRKATGGGTESAES